MRRFPGDYEKTPEYTENEKLPVGAYEVKLFRAEDQMTANGKEALCILFDIASGDYKDFYMRKFNNDKQRNAGSAKFKGVLRLWYPDGGQYDESAKSRMKTALKLIKEGNNLNVDYSKEWDGGVFKNCKIGMVFREQEWEYNGNTGMTAQPYAIISLEALKEGRFTIPKPKYLNGSKPSASSAFEEFQTPRDDDLPF